MWLSWVLLRTLYHPSPVKDAWTGGICAPRPGQHQRPSDRGSPAEPESKAPANMQGCSRAHDDPRLSKLHDLLRPGYIPPRMSSAANSGVQVPCTREHRGAGGAHGHNRPPDLTRRHGRRRPWGIAHGSCQGGQGAAAAAIGGRGRRQGARAPQGRRCQAGWGAGKARARGAAALVGASELWGGRPAPGCVVACSRRAAANGRAQLWCCLPRPPRLAGGRAARSLAVRRCARSVVPTCPNVRRAGPVRVCAGRAGGAGLAEGWGGRPTTHPS